MKVGRRRMVPLRLFQVLLALSVVPLGGRSTTHQLCLFLGFAGLYVHAAFSRRLLRLSGLLGFLSFLNLGAVFWCLFQVFDVGGLLGWISPKAYELRQTLAADSAMSISYEPAETRLWALHHLTVFLALSVFPGLASPRSRNSSVSKAMVASGLIALGAGIVADVIGPAGSSGESRSTLLLGTFANPNHASAFFAFCGLNAAALAFRRRNLGSTSLVACVILLMASQIQGSTGGFLALLFSLGLAFFAVNSRKALTIAIPALGLLLGGWLFRKSSFLALAVRAKLSGMESAIRIIDAHPVAGVGKGAFSTVYPHYADDPMRLLYTNPENLLLQRVCDWGIGPGSIYAAGVVVCITYSLLYARTWSTGLLSAALAGLVLHDLADFALELAGVHLLFMVSLGAVVSLRSTTPRLPIARWVAFLPLVAGLLILPQMGTLESLHEHRKEWQRKEPGATHVLSTSRAAYLTRVHPLNAFAWLALARAQLRDSDSAAAARSINHAMIVGPYFPGTNEAGGDLLMVIGRREQAMLEYRLAWTRSREPKSWADKILRLAKDGREAILAAPRGPQGFHPSSDALLLLARTSRSLRGDDFAADLLSHIEPGVMEDLAPQKVLDLAGLALAVGRRETALRFLVSLVENRDLSNGHVLATARLYRAIGEARTALALVESLPSEQPDVCLLRARSKVDLGSLEEALAVLRGCPPTGKRVEYWQRSWYRVGIEVEERLGEYRKALRLTSEWLERSPSDRELLATRVRLLRRLGRHGQASVEDVVLSPRTGGPYEDRARPE